MRHTSGAPDRGRRTCRSQHRSTASVFATSGRARANASTSASSSQTSSSAREPRPPAKLIAAARPGGAVAASAMLAKPPAETPTAIMPSADTSVRFFMASIAARKSAADVARCAQIIAIVAGAVGLGIWAARVTVTPAHHDQCRKTAPGEFDRLTVHPIGRHGWPCGLIARRAVADQCERVALRARRPHQHRLEPMPGRPRPSGCADPRDRNPSACADAVAA